MRRLRVTVFHPGGKCLVSDEAAIDCALAEACAGHGHPSLLSVSRYRTVYTVRRYSPRTGMESGVILRKDMLASFVEDRLVGIKRELKVLVTEHE